MRRGKMKRIHTVIVFLILVSCLFSATVKGESTLNLLLPDDTLNFRFASDKNGTVLTEAPKFYLLTASVKGNQYAVAYTSFYVWYDVFMYDSVKLTLEASTESTSESSVAEKVELATKKNAGIIAALDAKTLVIGENEELIESGSTTVCTFTDRLVYQGSKKYYLAFDITDAKKGSTYKGKVSLKVEVNT